MFTVFKTGMIFSHWGKKEKYFIEYKFWSTHQGYRPDFSCHSIAFFSDFPSRKKKKKYQIANRKSDWVREEYHPVLKKTRILELNKYCHGHETHLMCNHKIEPILHRVLWWLWQHDNEDNSPTNMEHLTPLADKQI